jgi:hypothetical protein
MDTPRDNGNKAPVLTGPELLPGRKRQRVWTPEKGRTDFDWMARIQQDADFIKGKIGTAALGIKSDKLVNLGGSLSNILSETLVAIFERQANTFSDFVNEYGKVRDENQSLRATVEALQEDLESTKASKNKVEFKASKKEMEERVKVANSQFKVMNLDIGRDFADRKAMNEAAKAAMQAKVRSDLRAAYDSKIGAATVRILAKETVKRAHDGKEIWTAPVLVTVQDRETRWEVEDVLRKSKVYPAFHWPREMVDNVRVFRETVQDLGFSEEEYYIRIRPEERDGQWRIKADAKAKQGNTRFSTVASFDIPPLDDDLKNTVTDWAKPTWVKPGVVRGGRGQAPTASNDDEITQEDIIMNM